MKFSSVTRVKRSVSLPSEKERVEHVLGFLDGVKIHSMEQIIQVDEDGSNVHLVFADSPIAEFSLEVHWKGNGDEQ